MTTIAAPDLQTRKLLARASQQVGEKIPRWVQGGGGNLSMKSDDTLWIKSSGSRLDSVAETRGLAAVELSRFTSGMRQAVSAKDRENSYSKLIEDCALYMDQGFGRPSMETGFHAVLPSGFVAHFHSLVAIAVTDLVFKDGSARADWDEYIRSQGWTPAWIDYVTPGVDLCEALATCAGADAIFLRNHGVLLQASETSVLERWSDLEMKIVDRHEDLRGLLASGLNVYESAMRLSSEWLDAPPVFFPDVAVFADRLKTDWTSAKRKGQELTEAERNSLEIIVAVSLLEKFAPYLDSIAPSEAAKLSKLPVEAFRRERTAP